MFELDNKPNIILAVTDFPDPDSPTNATFSPRPIFNDIFFKAVVMPSKCLNLTSKFFIDNNVITLHQTNPLDRLQVN